MNIDFLIPLLSMAFVLSIPVGLAAVGECICQRTGLLNLGVEGMMLMGALTAFLGAFYFDSSWIGVLTGVAGGVSLGILMGVLCISIKAEQVVSGIVVVLLSLGLTSYLYGSLFHVGTTPPRIEGLALLHIPLLSNIPVIGPILFQQTSLVYASLALIVLLSWMLERTSLGLALQAVGEKPEAGDAAGLSVDGLRWFGILISSAMAGLGGAVLIIAQLHLFADHITAGRGWIAIALVIFGRWKPLWVFAGALLFGVVDAIQLKIQVVAGGIDSAIPFELFQALPYVITMAVLVLSAMRARRNAQPSALGIPFIKGQKH
ncbi:ABC transporter permease [Aminobacter aganoensis]|uniref:Simple sugar transport system permease protein n=1 Tax=Aminobacter aganoensis TaxID=83264 RepID=A0A7X0FCK1_9HYPH|nr:ABC transporter permease [Aminobacter aganoensis]MBB6357257.1 simple sugar transport system permease protein [Aminobacter aganoensis]